MITFRNLAIAGTAAMSLALTQLPAGAAEVLFGTSGAGEDNASSLYTIDPTTGVATLVGPLGFNEVVSIDFDPLTGVLYGISNSVGSAIAGRLITINTATGAGAVVAPVTGPTITNNSQFSDMSFASDGTLYVWDAFAERLITINLTTGVAAEIGPNTLGLNGRTGLDVDSTDTIYLKIGRDSRIYTLDATTGAETFEVEIGGSFDNVLAELAPISTGQPGIALEAWGYP